MFEFSFFSIYQKNANIASEMFRDKLNSPLDKAVYWTEYVLKHENMEYFDVINRDMYFYETVHLDVILFILLLLLLIVVVVLIGLYCCCCKSSKVSNNKSKTS